MNGLISFFENLFYRPKWYHWSVSIVLLPISLLYAFIMWIRRICSNPKYFGIPVISIGNLFVGGSGKTPVTIAIAKSLQRSAVVLRGYGRKSTGLVVVSEWGDIKTDVKISGDEAMLLAKSLPKATVIVSEDRVKGIRCAKLMGAKVALLDDGFSKIDIEKYEILLYPKKMPNKLPLPSGPFREFSKMDKYADMVLKEDKDFRRIVTCSGCDEPMLLVTAIANPQRLNPFLPKPLVKGRFILPDHAWFEAKEIKKAMQKIGVKKILTTEKDSVKLEKFGLNIALLKLEMSLNPEILQRIKDYVKNKEVLS